jgi:hypothetical protein
MADARKEAAQKFLDKNAHDVDQRLATFAQSAELFSESKPRFIETYENQWVAAHDGAVVAAADTLAQVMAMLAGAGISPSETMIRHIDRNPKTLIM